MVIDENKIKTHIEPPSRYSVFFLGAASAPSANIFLDRAIVVASALVCMKFLIVRKCDLTEISKSQ